MTSRILHLRDQRGAVAVEFAIVFIILAVLIFAIIEFGLFFSRYQVYQGAAREGARVAATRASTSDIQSRVLSAAEPYSGGPYAISENPTVVVEGGNGASTPCDQGTRGREVEVSWNQDFKDAIVLPFIPDIGFSARISGVFRCE